MSLNGSFLPKIEKIDMNYVRNITSETIENCESEKSKPKPNQNLIPINHQKVIATILGNQQKFDIVMERVIEALDRLHDGGIS